MPLLPRTIVKCYDINIVQMSYNVLYFVCILLTIYTHKSMFVSMCQNYATKKVKDYMKAKWF